LVLAAKCQFLGRKCFASQPFIPASGSGRGERFAGLGRPIGAFLSPSKEVDHVPRRIRLDIRLRAAAARSG
jgi:hypothetical protein